MPEKLIIYTDGGARGNPGHAAAGVVVYKADKQLLKKASKYLGERTNNEAEYEAVVLALGLAAEFGARELQFFLDSELVVRQLNNIYRVRERKLQALMLKVRELERQYEKISYEHVPRARNAVADALVNECLDEIASHPQDK